LTLDIESGYLRAVTMKSFKALYKATMPEGWRRYLWEVRRQGWRQTIRGPVASLRVACGRPLARAKLEGEGRICVDLRDHGVGRPLYVERQYEPSETAFVRRYVQPGMSVVDVGANLGYYTLLAANRVGAIGRVLAIEPDPHNFALLQKNVSGNLLSNVTMENSALGARGAEAALFLSRLNYGDHRLHPDASGLRVSIAVKVRTLDEIVDSLGWGTIDFLKMDVQGYEYEVLLGMKKILGASPRVVVLTEFWPHGLEMAGSSPAAFLSAFHALGFTTSVLESGGAARQVTVPQIAAQIDRKEVADSEHTGQFLNLILEKRPAA
jgi:FkbM family methyltransferase